MYTLTKEALYGPMKVFNDGVKSSKTGLYRFVVDACIEEIPVEGLIEKTPVFLKAVEYSDKEATYSIYYKED
jgi:hypothetical protein